MITSRYSRGDHFIYQAGERGIEPLLTVPETAVLPLDDSPVLGWLQAEKSYHAFNIWSNYMTDWSSISYEENLYLVSSQSIEDLDCGLDTFQNLIHPDYGHALEEWRADSLPGNGHPQDAKELACF